MKQAYVEPDVQVLTLSLEMSLLSGGSNEGFTEKPGLWEAPFMPNFPSFPF